MSKKDFIIITDTSEQLPWKFKNKPMVSAKLDYGDYSIEGIEHLFSIERKRNTAELAKNMTEKRFPKLLTQLSKLKYKYIICEFSFCEVVNYPLGSGIPQYLHKKIKVSSNWMIKYISDILTKYNIPVIFAGCSKDAERLAYSIMKEVVIECKQQKSFPTKTMRG